MLVGKFGGKPKFHGSFNSQFATGRLDISARDAESNSAYTIALLANAIRHPPTSIRNLSSQVFIKKIMSAEIICVGTELLLGDILNSNARYLAQELAKLGIPHYYQCVVGDNPVRIKNVIQVAIARSSILIFTGGLGPTPDDLTLETLADFFCDTPRRKSGNLTGYY
jgi:molybdopterin biosynthesis enzyme